MAWKIHTPERIIGMLRKFEVRLAQGEKALGVLITAEFVGHVWISPAADVPNQRV